MAQGWSGSDIYSSTPPTCNRGEGAETNVFSETFYDTAGNAIASRDARGTVTRTYYDKVKRPTLVVQHLTSQAYTVNAPPASSAFGNDHDVAAGTVYDDGGRAIASVEYLVQGGQVISHTTRTYYDPLNRSYLVVQNLDPAHDMYDPAPPACNRDSTGLVEPHNVCRETVYHPQSGNTIASIDPLGRVDRTYYDNLDRPVMQVRNLTSQPYALDTPPPSSSFGNDHDVASSVQYDDQGNAIASAEWLVESGQPVSHTVRTFYDQLDRPLSVVRNFAGELADPQPLAFDPNYPDRNLRLDTAYASDGSSLASIEWLANEVGQPITRTTRAYYDGLGRAFQVVQNLDPAWDWANPSPPACNRDSTGTQGTYNVCQETSYNAGSEMVSSKDALGQITNYTYDLLGRLKIVSDPSSYQTAYVYDANGNRIKVTDAEAVVTRYEYDELDRLEAVVENYLPGVDPDQQTNVRTEYTYDARGNRLSILDGNDHLTSFLYDALGRLESETDALSNQWIYRYDVAGNRVGLLDANQAITVYEYDGLYRLNSIDYPAPDPDVAFETNALGWRKIMTDGLGLTAWQFDNLGRPITITHPLSGTVSYRYDAQGNRTHLFYPDGKSVSYTYDLLDRLASVEDWNTKTIAYKYDVAGHLIQSQLPNGVVTSYQFNPSGWLEELSHQWGEDLLSSFVYQNDQVGNRTGITETIYLSPTLTTTVITYGYDPLYRLTQASYSTGDYFTYTHDAVGNRLTQQSLSGTNTYLYDSANRLSSVDGITYTWDANGNLLSDGLNTFSYDKANRLKSFIGASLSTSYAYNGLGDRMQQTVNGVPQTYLLDTATGLTQVLADGTNIYLYGVDRISQQGASGTEYFLGDALGSMRQLVDTGGNVTLAKSYDPYGEVLDSDGGGSSSYGFTGEWTDSNGLVNLRARYYEPGMGRFIGRDAWEGDDSKPISYNKWIYAYANPLFWTDPTGNRIYDRNKAVQYGYLHDLEKAHEPNVFTFDSDCSNFVSLSLYAGGVRDRRPDPFRGWIMSEGKPNPEYEPISYWDKWKAYKKNIKNEQYNKHFSWTNVNVLFDFLTTIVDFKSYPYTDFIPRFSQISTIIDFNTPGWLNFLSSTPIMPGDVVMYSPDGITWKHAALIVDASDSQTFYNVNDPINHPPNNRCTYPEKPRVIERSGEIIYSASGSRSIDNTSGIYLAIMIIHIPDIVPDQMNPFR